MKAIQVPVINKLNLRKLRSRRNHRATMLVLFLLANVAVSYGRAEETIKNDRKLITMLDNFNLSQLSDLLSDVGEIIENKEPLLLHSDLNQNQNKKSVIVNAEKSNTKSTKNINNFPVDIDDMDFGEVINLIKSKSANNNANSNLDLSNLELLLKLHRALLKGEITTTSTTPVPTTTKTTTTTLASSSSPVDKTTISNLKLENDLKHFVHTHEVDDLKKMLDLDAEEEEKEDKEDVKGREGKTIEKNVVLKNKKFDSNPKSDMVPSAKAKLPKPKESVFVNKLQARKLGINIPVFRIKVDDKVPIMGRAEVTMNVDEFKPFFWALAIFLSLLFVAIVLSCVFGVVYLQKMQAKQYREFLNQNQFKEPNSRGCSSRRVSVIPDRERRLSRLPPACRCGCEDDITKSHIADIIRRDFDRDSGTSSQVGGTSVV